MAVSALTDLERRRERFGPAAPAVKLKRLRHLARTRLRTAEQVRRLHEVLCFMRAYPDDADVLRSVEAMLERFDRRADLRAHREALAYSGIAGTTLWFPFFYPTACWLARRWPALLTLERADTTAGESIAGLLPACLTPVEAHAVREARLSGFAALDRLRGRQTDATFLINRVAALPADERTREAFYDAINPSCELAPGPDTPSRTRGKWSRVRPAWQKTPLRRNRPELAAELDRAPRSMRAVSTGQGQELLQLAREALVTRARDLDAFAYGNERDVWLIEDGGGLAFALIGMTAERRAVVPAVYGGLTLQNGVPVGYHQSDLTGRSAAISFNTFETFRGGESAWVFARLLAALRHGFGSTSFSIEPYQLGKGNEEGLASGAWWFYARLGFRPRARAGVRLAQRELDRRARSAGYRTGIDTLKALAEHHLFFDADGAHRAPLIAASTIGLAVGRHLTDLAGSERAEALAMADRRARAACGIGSLKDFSDGERKAWQDFAPLLSALNTTGWSAADRDALVKLVRAKAAVSERGYVTAFASLPAFERALSTLRSSA
jgi:hypothetical protein